MKTNPIIENQIIADEIVRMTDGVSVFCGVVNESRDTFFPFYGVASEYGDQFIFQPNETMPFSQDPEDSWEDVRGMDALLASFNHRQTQHPQAVTNIELFHAVLRNAQKEDSA